MTTSEQTELRVTPGYEGDGPGCPCCGGASGRVFGFVYRGAEPLGVYQAGEGGLPGSGEVVIGVTLGSFAHGTTADDRLIATFLAEAGEGAPRLTDRAVPGWPEMDGQGVRLTAAEANRHPRLNDLRAMADIAIAHDARLRDALTPRGSLVMGFAADAPAGNGPR